MSSKFHVHFLRNWLAGSATPVRTSRRQNQQLTVAILEDRNAPATFTWVNAAGGSWHTASNWDQNAVPGSTDDVVIPDLAGDQTITYSVGTSEVASVVANEQLKITGGTLSIDGTFSGNQSLIITNGTLANAVTQEVSQLTAQGGTLDGVTIDGDATISSGVRIQGVVVNGSMRVVGGNYSYVSGGLTVNGTLKLGDDETNNVGRLQFVDSQTLGGTGTVLFDSFSTYNFNSNQLLINNPATLTVGPGVTVKGKWGDLSGNLILQGTVDTGNGQGRIRINSNSSTTWTNTGTLRANGGSLETGGSWTNSGTLIADSGRLDIAGLDNSNKTLDLPAGAGEFSVSGTLKGGTVKGDPFQVYASGMLDGVTIEGNATLVEGPWIQGVVVNGTLRVVGQRYTKVSDGLTVNGTLILGDDETNNMGRMQFNGSQTLGGTGTVLFDSFNSNYLSGSGSMTLTVGPGVTVKGKSGDLYGNLILQGTVDTSPISPDYSSGRIGINSNITNTSSWTNTGTLRVNGGSLETGGTWTNSGLIQIASGYASLIGTNWSSTTPIRIDQGYATLSGTNPVVSGLIIGAKATASINSSDFQFAEGTSASGRGSLEFVNVGKLTAPVEFETQSTDRGRNNIGFNTGPFLGSLKLTNSFVTLVDHSDNTVGDGAEATYLNSLDVGIGSGFDLNNLNFYTRSAKLSGNISGGVIQLLSDLTVTQVNAPATANPGDLININWTTKNVGESSITGPWQDVVYLSADDVLDLADVRLAIIPLYGSLAAGASSPMSTTIELPEILPGSYRFLVETDRRGSIDNGYGVTNNALAATATTVTIPTLLFDQSTAQSFTRSNEKDYYQFSVTTGDQAVRVRLNGNNVASNELYVGYEGVPSTTNTSFYSREHGELVIPSAKAGTYYVMVHHPFHTSDNANYSILLDQPGLAVREVLPSRIALDGEASLTIRGTDINTDAKVELIGPEGATLLGSYRSLDSNGSIHVLVNTTNAVAGQYTLRLTQDTKVVELPDAVSIEALQQGKLDIDVTTPSIVRAGRPYDMIVEYRNSGFTNVPLGFLSVSATNGKLMLPGESVARAEQRLITLGGSGDMTSIPPGGSGRVTLTVIPTGRQNVQITTKLAGDLNIPFPWEELAMQPPASVDAAEWSNVVANAKPVLGTNWQDVINSATVGLAALGSPTGTLISANNWLLSRIQEAAGSVNPLVRDVSEQNLVARDASNLLGPTPVAAFSAHAKGPERVDIPENWENKVQDNRPLTEFDVKLYERGTHQGNPDQVYLIIHGWNGLTQRMEYDHRLPNDNLPGPDFQDRMSVLAQSIVDCQSESDSNVAVYVVDWSAGARGTLSGDVARNIQPTADAIYQIMKENPGKFPPEKTTIVGESFGTYVASEVARRFNGVESSQTIPDSPGTNRIKKIVALNPANPAGTGYSAYDQGKTLQSGVIGSAAFGVLLGAHNSFNGGLLATNISGDSLYFHVPSMRYASDSIAIHTNSIADGTDSVGNVDLLLDVNSSSFPSLLDRDGNTNTVNKHLAGPRWLAECLQQHCDMSILNGSSIDLVPDSYPTADQYHGSIKNENGEWCEVTPQPTADKNTDFYPVLPIVGSDSSDPFANPGYASTRETTVITSVDPNDILGPAGAGSDNWLPSTSQLLPYTIRFENVSTATAPAQDVVITHQLDADLDWTTFEFGTIRMGSSTAIPVASGQQHLALSVGYVNQDGSPLRVDVDASINSATGLVTWTFRSLDPETGDFPFDPFAGFLPPNDNTGRGEGSVSYTVRAKSGLATGARLDAQASIVFDTNESILTPAIYNTIDADAPTAVVETLPGFSPAQFTVTWNGDDRDGSGINRYDVYVSVDGDPYQQWLDDTPLTDAVYDGVDGKSYSFAAVAMDAVGNRLVDPATGQTTTRVDAAAPTSRVNDLPSVSPATFNVTWSGNDSGSGVAHYDVYVSVDGGPYTPMLTGTQSTSHSFTGEPGKQYAFLSQAIDVVGNREVAPALPDASTRVTANVPNTPPTISDIPNLQFAANSADNLIHFRVTDVETALAQLTTQVSSSNESLIPHSAILIEGMGEDRTLRLTPANGQTGISTISVTITDADGLFATDTFDVTITEQTSTNQPPVATADSAIAPYETAVLIPVLANDSDPDFDAIDISSVTQPQHGTATIVDNQVKYEPTPGYSGQDTFAYTISDGRNGISTATVALTISPPSTGSPPLLVGSREFAVGMDMGGSQVTLYNPDQSPRYTITPFEGFTGGIRTATADFNKDGNADLVVGTGPGRATRVRILDGVTQRELFAVNPFEETFHGGVYLSVGDVTGDGIPDLAITPDKGGGPRVDVFSGAVGFPKLTAFFGIDDPNFRGGARSAISDMSGDGIGDLVVVAGFGGGPRVAGYDGTTLSSTPKKLFNDFFVFEQTLRNGVFVTAGDLNGDGFADLIVGGGPGGGPRVFALDGQSLKRNEHIQLANFFGGDPSSRGGIRLSVKNLDGDERTDIVVGAGADTGSGVTAYLGKSVPQNGTPTQEFLFDAFDAFTGGVFVG
ncbi:MAG: Ig-like domain-containing protein [Gemmataceae bacterium]